MGLVTDRLHEANASGELFFSVQSLSSKRERTVIVACSGNHATHCSKYLHVSDIVCLTRAKVKGGGVSHITVTSHSSVFPIQVEATATEANPFPLLPSSVPFFACYKESLPLCSFSGAVTQILSPYVCLLDAAILLFSNAPLSSSLLHRTILLSGVHCVATRMLLNSHAFKVAVMCSHSSFSLQSPSCGSDPACAVCSLSFFQRYVPRLDASLEAFARHSHACCTLEVALRGIRRDCVEEVVMWEQLRERCEVVMREQLQGKCEVVMREQLQEKREGFNQKQLKERSAQENSLLHDEFSLSQPFMYHHPSHLTHSIPSSLLLHDHEVLAAQLFFKNASLVASVQSTQLPAILQFCPFASFLRAGGRYSFRTTEYRMPHRVPCRFTVVAYRAPEKVAFSLFFPSQPLPLPLQLPPLTLLPLSFSLLQTLFQSVGLSLPNSPLQSTLLLLPSPSQYRSLLSALSQPHTPQRCSLEVQVIHVCAQLVELKQKDVGSKCALCVQRVTCLCSDATITVTRVEFVPNGSPLLVGCKGMLADASTLRIGACYHMEGLHRCGETEFCVLSDTVIRPSALEPKPLPFVYVSELLSSLSRCVAAEQVPSSVHVLGVLVETVPLPKDKTCIVSLKDVHSDERIQLWCGEEAVLLPRGQPLLVTDVAIRVAQEERQPIVVSFAFTLSSSFAGASFSSPNPGSSTVSHNSSLNSSSLTSLNSSSLTSLNYPLHTTLLSPHPYSPPPSFFSLPSFAASSYVWLRIDLEALLLFRVFGVCDGCGRVIDRVQEHSRFCPAEHAHSTLFAEVTFIGQCGGVPVVGILKGERVWSFVGLEEEERRRICGWVRQFGCWKETLSVNQAVRCQLSEERARDRREKREDCLIPEVVERRAVVRYASPNEPRFIWEESGFGVSSCPTANLRMNRMDSVCMWGSLE